MDRDEAQNITRASVKTKLAEFLTEITNQPVAPDEIDTGRTFEEYELDIPKLLTLCFRIERDLRRRTHRQVSLDDVFNRQHFQKTINEYISHAAKRLFEAAPSA
jgi:hypothetical protein